MSLKRTIQKKNEAEKPALQTSKQLWKKIGIVTIETLAVLSLLLGVALGFLIWRLSSGPLDIGFAKNYIQEALRDDQRGIYTTMDSVVLHWPDLSGPLLLGLRNGRVYNAQKELIVSVDEVALALSKAKLFIGKISPEALILKKPSLRVIRQADNSFDIAFGKSGVEEASAFLDQEADQTALTTRILSYIARPGTEKNSTSPLAALSAFEVQEAEVIIEDLALSLSWRLPRVDLSFKSVREGLAAHAYIEIPSTGKISKETAFLQSDIFLDWETHGASMEASLHNFNTEFLAEKIPELDFLKKHHLVFDAKFHGIFDPEMNVENAVLDVSSSQGDMMLEQLSPEPVVYQDLVLQALYDDKSKTLSIPKFKITSKDVTFEGRATLNRTENSVTGPVRLEIQNMDHAQIAPLWPAVLEGDSSQEWIVHRLSDGHFKDVFAQADLKMEKSTQGDWSFDADGVKAGFSFEGMSVNYRPPLAPVKNASGQGLFSLDEEKLSIDITSANLKDMQVSQTHLAFDNIIEAGAGIADMNIKLNGPLKSALSYIAVEPINVKPDMDISKAAGTADLDINIGFPTVKDLKVEDIKINIAGKLDGVRLPKIVRDMDITGGPFALSVKNNAFTMQGKGALNERPLTLEYNEFLNSEGQAYSSQVKASLVADEKLREGFGMDLSEFIAGPAALDVTYTKFNNEKSEAVVHADITPARLFINPFDYEKPTGAKGSVTLKAHLQNGVLKRITELQGTAPNLKLEPSLLTFRKNKQETELEQIKVSRFILGETIGTLDVKFEKSGRIKAVLEGPFLDLRPFLGDENEEKKEQYNEPPLVLSVAVDRMRTANGETVQYGKIYADINSKGQFNQLEMDAIAGSGDIYLRYKPDNSGKRTFRLEADDAGATLKAFDVYSNIIGGKLIIYGEPIRGVFDRNLIGVAEITDFKAVKAPALAQLLGAMSLPGVLALLSDDGISFTKLEANFDWMYRKKGSLLILKNGRTSGNSLGLTFDGTFDNMAGTLDVSGTLIPLSGINAFIGSIPLVGEILTGGSGGIFAATYKVKGDAKNPDISVNPLSVLAPGILRRILFE